jgi:hypothetical protein
VLWLRALLIHPVLLVAPWVIAARLAATCAGRYECPL